MLKAVAGCVGAHSAGIMRDNRSFVGIGDENQYTSGLQIAFDLAPEVGEII